MSAIEAVEAYMTASLRALIVFKGPVGGCFVQCGIRPHCIVSIMASPFESRRITGERCRGAML